jgi:adenosine deaminase
MELAAEIEAFVQRMPKVELHLHLEGAVAPQTLLDLAARNGVDLPAHDVAGVERMLHYRDFAEFLRVFMLMAQTIVHGEDFARVAYELGVALAVQHVRYAEVMLSPMQHINRGMNLRETIEGTAAGFAQAASETGINVRLALDHGRQYGPELAWYVLEVARETMPLGVVGWSIGGNELDFPPEPFAEVYAAARSYGLGVMAHAGEVVGPPSVWGAVEQLGCQRIGHGIRSIDDPHLVQTLRQRGVVLDICPSSNIRTGAATSWAAHPLRALYAAGVPITINSDDPLFFQTTLTEEYRRAIGYLGLTVDDLCATVITATEAAFLPSAERIQLRQQVATEVQQLRQELGV